MNGNSTRFSFLSAILMLGLWGGMKMALGLGVRMLLSQSHGREEGPKASFDLFT